MNRLNCASYESLIALFVEGDLRDTDRLRVEKHLKRCARCEELLIELQESQAAFKMLRHGVVNNGALSEVRERVLNDVGDLAPAPAWAVAVHRLIFAGLRRRTAIAGVAVGVLLLGAAGMGTWHWSYRNAPVTSASASQVAMTVNEPPVHANVAGLDATEKETFIEPVKATPKSRNRRAAANPPDARIAAQTDLVQFPIKFVTDDPNIIIYWLPSDQGD